MHALIDFNLRQYFVSQLIHSPFGNRIAKKMMILFILITSDNYCCQDSGRGASPHFEVPVLQVSTIH